MVGTVGGTRFVPVQEFKTGNDGTVQQARVGNGANAPRFGQGTGGVGSDFATRMKNGFAAFKSRMKEFAGDLKTTMTAVKDTLKDWTSKMVQPLKNARIAVMDRYDDWKAGGARNDNLEIGKLDDKWPFKTARGRVAQLFTGQKRNVNQAPVPLKTDVSSALNSVIRELKARPGNYEVNRAMTLNHLLKAIPAYDLANMDPTVLRGIATEFRNEGRTEKAEFLDVLVGMLDDLGDLDTARPILMDLAKGAMQAKNAETFLRSTTNSDAAAIKKLMTAAGMDDVASLANMHGNLLLEETGFAGMAPVFENSGVKGVGNLNRYESPDLDVEDNTALKRDMMENATEYATRLLTDLAGVEPLEGIKEVLSDLAKEIQDRVGAEENGLTQDQANDLIFKLYADQVFLKGYVPALSNQGLPPLMRVGGDIILQVANGKDGTKFTGDVREIYQDNLPVMSDLMNAILVDNFGMPAGARQNIEL